MMRNLKVFIVGLIVFSSCVYGLNYVLKEAQVFVQETSLSNEYNTTDNSMQERGVVEHIQTNKNITTINLQDGRIIETEVEVKCKKGDLVSFYKVQKNDNYFVVDVYRVRPISE